MYRRLWAIIQKPDLCFLFFGSILGFLFLFITPPFQAPDENNHFYRAYQISEFRFIGEKHGRLKSGGRLPESLGMDITHRITFHPERKLIIKDITDHLKTPLNPEKRVFISFPNIVVFFPLDHIPQALYILPGRLLRAPPLVIHYLGRLGNLTFWLLLIFISIRIIPVGKWLFCLMALSPMSIFMAASLSGDTLTNALGFLIIAYILNIALKQPSAREISIDSSSEIISGKETLILFILCVGISLAKISYWPVILLYFTIPPKRLGSKKQFFLTGLILVVTCLTFMTIWYANVRDLYSLPVPDPWNDPEKQLAFITENPIRFIGIMHQSVVTNIYEYMEQYVGTLGWLDTRLPDYIFISWIAMLFLVVLTEPYRGVIPGGGQKAIFLVIFMLITMALLILVYISWNTVGSIHICGIQGRYFIPFAPLFFMIFLNRWKGITSPWRNIFIILFLIFVYRITFDTILQRFYDLPPWYFNMIVALDVILPLVIIHQLYRCGFTGRLKNIFQKRREKF